MENENNNFENYSNSIEKFKSSDINNSIDRGKVTVNFNAPVLNITDSGGEDKKKNNNLLSNVTNLIDNGTKLAKISTTIAAITSPMWAPKLAEKTFKLINHQLIKDTSVKDGVVMLPTSDKKEYFEKIQDNDNKFIFQYENTSNYPLTNYLISIKEELNTGKKFKFSEENSFTKFFDKYLQRKENLIRYTETYVSKIKEENKTVTDKIVYELYKNEDKEFCFSIYSVIKAVVSDYKEGESPEDFITPELIKK